MSLIMAIPDDERPLPTGDMAVLSAIYILLKTLKNSRPGDRSDRDRWYSICITDVEKLDAIFRSQILARREEENATA